VKRVVVGLAVLALGCGPSDGGPDAACLRTLPTCPTPAPSYTGEVSTVIHDRCVTCHFPGSTLAPIDLSTYAAVRARQGLVLGQVYVCNMPPRTATPLSEDERTVLIQWLQCGAPDN
jgi:uncharacterized membrane protein